MSVMEDLLDCEWGQQLLSDYHVVKCIHMTSMSEVYTLESADGRQRLVLKAMNPALTSPQLLKTLTFTADEDTTSTDIDGLVPIKDFYISQHYAYVVKPYIEGVSLQDYMAHGQTIGTILGIVKQLAQIVNACHSLSPALILRDIKPDNLILSQGKLFILDTESSKMKSSTLSNRDTVLLGTPGFAAPEQYGFQTSDERTDVYAIGQVMHILLQLAIGSKAKSTTSQLKLSFDALLEGPLFWSARRIVQRATAFDPQRRYQSANSVKKAIDAIYPKIYMSLLTVFVLVVGIGLVGFRSPDPLASSRVSDQPTLHEVTMPSINSFTTTIYRSQIDERLKDFDAFTVLGTNTEPSRAKEFMAMMVEEGKLHGLATASLSKDSLKFNSHDSYVDNHIIAFLKNNKLLGYIYINDGVALPYVMY